MAKIKFNSQQKPNIPPTVNAGVDQNIALPQQSVELLAIANDVDGYIVSQQWTQVSGPPAVITSSTSLGTTVTGLNPGTYAFQIIVFDNYGATATDTVNIVVANYEIFPFVWIGGETQCEEAADTNTGNVEYLTLVKVSNPDLYPLDVNNQRTSQTGLPQATKPNVISDANYQPPYQDLQACPRNRFYSVLNVNRVSAFNVKMPPTSTPCGPLLRGGSLDNSIVVENTMNGSILRTLGEAGGAMLTMPVAGNYYINIVGSGIASLNFINTSTPFNAPLDFIAQINNVHYQLSPVIHWDWSDIGSLPCDAQYALSRDTGYGGQGKNINWAISLNIPSIALPQGAVVDLAFFLRMGGSTAFKDRNANFSISTSHMIIEVKQI